MAAVVLSTKRARVYKKDQREKNLKKDGCVSTYNLNHFAVTAEILTALNQLYLNKTLKTGRNQRKKTSCKVCC